MVGLSVFGFASLVANLGNVTEQPVNKTSGIGQTKNGFCSFLPRHSGYAKVADGEPAGISFCTAKTLILGNETTSQSFKAAETFPSGFIQSQHYKYTANYSQVTGCFDRTKYDLNPEDGGGQFDIVSSNGPPICLGYKYFVNLVEPDAQQYCMRCCHFATDCNRYLSEYGCHRIIADGDYTDTSGKHSCDSIEYKDNTSPFSAYTNTINGESLTRTTKSKATTTKKTTTTTTKTTSNTNAVAKKTSHTSHTSTKTTTHKPTSSHKSTHKTTTHKSTSTHHTVKKSSHKSTHKTTHKSTYKTTHKSTKATPTPHLHHTHHRRQIYAFQNHH